MFVVGVVTVDGQLGQPLKWIDKNLSHIMETDLVTAWRLTDWFSTYFTCYAPSSSLRHHVPCFGKNSVQL